MDGYVENIVSLIKAKENMFLKELKECKDSGLPTYIYGAGEGAENVMRRSQKVAIAFAGKLVDKDFYHEGQDGDCLEDVLSQNKVNLVVAHRGFNKLKLEPYRDNIAILIDRDCFSGNYDADPNMMTREFVELNEDKLTMVYNSLSDEKSKQTFLAYINQKISMDYSYLKDVKSSIQYFDADIIDLENHETFIDAGAYTGDTVDCFIEQLKNRGIETYEAIYSFEPDPVNYDRLKNKKYKKFHPFCLATSEWSGEVMFQSRGKGSSSSISGEDGCLIKMDTIDHILHEKPVTFLKMDVEGYELASLRGAQKVIRKWRPKLAICIYHKRQDLWEVLEYIASLVPSYRFYMRAYDDTATELVLYATIDT